MSEGSKAVEAYSFLVAFANDRTIDAKELAFMEHIVLRDGVVDEDEKAVLHNIFGRVDPANTEPAVLEEIRRFREKYGID